MFHDALDGYLSMMTGGGGNEEVSKQLKGLRIIRDISFTHLEIVSN
jgi:hypothetical protein